MLSKCGVAAADCCLLRWVICWATSHACKLAAEKGSARLHVVAINQRVSRHGCHRLVVIARLASWLAWLMKTGAAGLHLPVVV
jgi:hypothetical protein